MHHRGAVGHLVATGGMRDVDGREVLLRLELPLSVTLVAALCEAVAASAHRLGYTDVVMLTDGTNRVVATPPARVRLVRDGDG